MNPQQKRTKNLRFQHGQAMVEYAILFIVLSILFIGGAELGMAALASYKNTDAAKTGISEYTEVNQRRLNILNAEKQYLNILAGFDCRVIYEILNEYDDDQESLNPNPGYLISPVPPATEPSKINITREMLFADEYDYTCTRPNQDSLNAGILITPKADNFNQLLDKIYNGESTIYSKESLYATIYNFAANLGQVDIDENGILTEEELLDAESLIIEFAPNNNAEGQLKYKTLLLIAHYKLSKLPLDSSQPLSQAPIDIGKHASADFISKPKCEPDGSYDYGFPEGDTDVDSDGNSDGRYIAATGEGHKVYLFNPLPIDLTSCEGNDASRGGRSRLSILVGGYSDPTDSTKYEPGLPKLNQAMYGMYQKVCSDGDGNFQSCGKNASIPRLLVPPGNLCIHDDCPNQDLIDGAMGPTGYYRWNKGSDGSGPGDLFKYTINNVEDELLNGFRPTMQLDCSSTTNFRGEANGLVGNINDPTCQGSHSKVRLHTRYRKVFEGFLTLGLQELNVSEDQVQDALKLFFNPNQVGVEGSSNIVGSPGSEVGPSVIKKNGNLETIIPTIKPHKDFRGCYEVDVETNQVSACN